MGGFDTIIPEIQQILKTLGYDSTHIYKTWELKISW